MSGERHPKPPNCPNTLYSTLLQCWQSDASLRPSFSDLADKLCSHAQVDQWPLLAAVVASLRFRGDADDVAKRASRIDDASEDGGRDSADEYMDKFGAATETTVDSSYLTYATAPAAPCKEDGAVANIVSVKLNQVAPSSAI